MIASLQQALTETSNSDEKKLITFRIEELKRERDVIQKTWQLMPQAKINDLKAQVCVWGRGRGVETLVRGGRH